MATRPPRTRRAAARRSASTTARSPTSPSTSRSCARPKPTCSSACRHPRATARHYRPRRRHMHDPHSVSLRQIPRPEGHRTTTIETQSSTNLGRYKFGWADSTRRSCGEAWPERGPCRARHLREEDEPAWRLEQRLKGLRIFEKKPMPLAGADLSGIDFDNSSTSCARPRSRPTAGTTCRPTSATPTTSSRIPEAEKQRLISGVAAEYESEVATTDS